MWRNIAVASLLFALSAYASDNNKEIQEAIKNGNVEKVMNIVNKNPSALKSTIPRFGYQYLPFQFAFVVDKWDVVEKLLNNYSLSQLGAYQDFTHPTISPKRTDTEPTGSVLHYATIQGKIDIIKKLINKGLDPMQQVDTTGETPLHIAARRGDEDIVKFLLSHEAVKNNINVADKNNKTPLGAARNNKHTDVAALLQKHGASTQPSKQKGGNHFNQKGGVKKPLNASDKTPIEQLKQAIENDDANAVIQLLKQESLTLGPRKEYMSIAYEFTLLQFAVYKNAHNVVDVLLKNYSLAQLHATKSFRFALGIRGIDFADVYLVHVPAKTGNRDILKRLVKAGLDPMKRVEQYAYTPLHIAAYHGNTEIVKYLLTMQKVKNNINAQAGKSNDKTALDMAHLQNRQDIISLLKKHGAQYNYYEEQQQKVSQAGYTQFQSMPQKIVQEYLRDLFKHLQFLRYAVPQ